MLLFKFFVFSVHFAIMTGITAQKLVCNRKRVGDVIVFPDVKKVKVETITGQDGDSKSTLAAIDDLVSK